MDMHERLVKAYTEYTTYLQEHEPIRLPYRPHVDDGQDWIYISQLGLCPLKAALERRKAEAKFPHMLKEYDVWQRHLMEQGKRDAAVLQEAIEFGADDYISDVEVVCRNNNLLLKGRMDAVIWFHGGTEPHIIEIKRRDLPKNGSQILQPKLTDVYQVMGYGLITGYPNMHVVLMNRYFFSTWTLQPDGKGFTVYGPFGDAWEHPNNRPEHLNFEMLKVEIERQRAYLNGSRTIIPNPDPLNDREVGWQCVSTKRYANQKPGSKGKVKPNCPYFCFGEVDEEIDIERQEDGTLAWDRDLPVF